MYGIKTTLYIPDDLKAALQRRATIEQRSEADIIREALAQATEGYGTPSPTLPIGPGKGPADLSEHVDDYLQGFGE